MSPDTAPILSVSKLVKRFGGFHALDGLSFHVAPGEILGLVGPNGSGKTTAINVISGLYAPDGGEVVLDGGSIGGVASHKLVHRGINRTFQIPKPFLSLTVRQNIEVALAYGRAAVAPPTMAALLDEYRLDRSRRPAGGRSEQRAAEDARSGSRARHPSAAVAARRTRRRAQSGGTRLDRRAHQGAGAERHGDHRGRASDGLHRAHHRSRHRHERRQGDFRRQARGRGARCRR